MKSYTLKLAGLILFLGSLVAWFVQPTRTVDWIPLAVLGIVVSLIDARLGHMEKRIAKVEST